MIITMDHVRHIHYCSSGIKLFSKRHGIDLGEFCKNGVDEEVLLATGDQMAIDLVEDARKWESQRQ